LEAAWLVDDGAFLWCCHAISQVCEHCSVNEREFFEALFEPTDAEYREEFGFGKNEDDSAHNIGATGYWADFKLQPRVLALLFAHWIYLDEIHHD
jgi:hypothetical protein